MSCFTDFIAFKRSFFKCNSNNSRFHGEVLDLCEFNRGSIIKIFKASAEKLVASINLSPHVPHQRVSACS